MTRKCKIFILAASIALPKSLNVKGGLKCFSEKENGEYMWEWRICLKVRAEKGKVMFWIEEMQYIFISKLYIWGSSLKTTKPKANIDFEQDF